MSSTAMSRMRFWPGGARCSATTGPTTSTTPTTAGAIRQAVRTEVRYGSQNVKNDLPSLQNYQNIIKNGGVCGRRAFFGRFILRVFGIPTVARPQKGHAALTHWTPKGWVVNLGAGWGYRDAQGSDGHDGRRFPAGDPGSETCGRHSERSCGPSGSAMSLASRHTTSLQADRRRLLERHGALSETGDRGRGEGGGTGGRSARNSARPMSPKRTERALVKATVTEADKKIVVGPDGVITIPAVACSKRSGIRVMKSFPGGTQLHSPAAGRPSSATSKSAQPAIMRSRRGW